MFTYLLPTSLMAMAVGGADGATEEIPMGIAFSHWNLIQFSACPPIMHENRYTMDNCKQVFTCFPCLDSERFGIRSSCNGNRGNTQLVGVEWVQPCEFLLDTRHIESEDIGSFYLDSLEGKVSDVAIGFIPLRDSPFDKKRSGFHPIHRQNNW